MIIDILESLLRIFDRLQLKVDTTDNTEFESSIDACFKQITLLIENWFNKEFNESILIGFDLEKVSKLELEQNQIMINEYRVMLEFVSRQNFSAMDEQMDFEMDIGNDRRRLSRNSPQEMRNRIRYYGLTNETFVYQRLLQIKDFLSVENFKTFLTRTLFATRIKDRISIRFEEVIKFRVKFQFETHFGEIGDILRDLVDEMIVDQLMNIRSDQKLDLETLYNTLIDNTPLNQELMQKYINGMLELTMPVQGETFSEYIELKFMFEWSSTKTLLDLDFKTQTKNSTRILNNDKWAIRWHRLMNLYVTTFNSIMDASERIGFIKVTILRRL